MKMPIDFDLMKDELIDGGYYEYVDDAINTMLQKAFQAGFMAGGRKAVATLAAKGMLHIQVHTPLNESFDSLDNDERMDRHE